MGTKSLAELEEFGYLTTPVTLVDGEVVVGFNRQRLERLSGDRAEHPD